MRERKCPIFETVAKGDSNPGPLDCESGILPLSYRSPHKKMYTSPKILAGMMDVINDKEGKALTQDDKIKKDGQSTAKICKEAAR